MSRIYCTKKLQDFVKNVEKELPVDLNKIVLSDWNAHLFFIEKRKRLIFVNNLTFYTVFMTDILKKDLKEIDSTFKKRLQEQLIHDKIIENSEIAESVFPELEISFYKTNNNKKVIGRINDFVDMFKVHCSYKYQNLSEMNVVYENGLINKTLTGKLFDVKKSRINPIQNVNEMIKTST